MYQVEPLTDAYQSDLGPDVILASAVKHVDRADESGIREFMNGTFSGGEQVVGLREGATDLVFNPKFAGYKETVDLWREKADQVILNTRDSYRVRYQAFLSRSA